MNIFSLSCRKFFLYFLLYSSFTPLLALKNLSTLSQDFVLETKQIVLKDYPDAFNPSIIRFQDSILMLFRIRDPFTTATNQIGMVLLDNEFNPIGIPQKLKIPIVEPHLHPMTQDPRLIWVGQDLYITYNDMISLPLSGENRRMFVAKLRFNGFDSLFKLEETGPILHFESSDPYKKEKNWAPFVWANKLFMSYSLFPHRVVNYIPSIFKAETVANTTGSIKWNWGTLRGGSAASVVDGENLGFFHSCKNMSTVQSGGKNITHYFMGAYTFSKEPPFEITKISPEPIFGHDFYTGPMYKTWTPLRVVFPGGFIHDKQHIWIAYGRQDHELWVVKLDKEKFYQSLLPVETIK